MNLLRHQRHHIFTSRIIIAQYYTAYSLAKTKKVKMRTELNSNEVLSDDAILLKYL